MRSNTCDRFNNISNNNKVHKEPKLGQNRFLSSTFRNVVVFTEEQLRGCRNSRGAHTATGPGGLHQTCIFGGANWRPWHSQTHMVAHTQSGEGNAPGGQWTACVCVSNKPGLFILSHGSAVSPSVLRGLQADGLTGTSPSGHARSTSGPHLLGVLLLLGLLPFCIPSWPPPPNLTFLYNQTKIVTAAIPLTFPCLPFRVRAETGDRQCAWVCSSLSACMTGTCDELQVLLGVLCLLRPQFKGETNFSEL